MDGNHTGGPRLYYCEDCAIRFDISDDRFRDVRRISREPKL